MDGGIHGVSDFSRCIAVIVLRFLLSFIPFLLLLWICLTLPAFTRAAVTYFSFACIFGGYTIAITRLILFCPWWLMNLYWFGMLVCMMFLYLNIRTYICVRVLSLSLRLSYRMILVGRECVVLYFGGILNCILCMCSCMYGYVLYAVGWWFFYCLIDGISYVDT